MNTESSVGTMSQSHELTSVPAAATENPEKPLPTFVLVHGGRHGGWCWKDVASRLRHLGHEVYTPTLTGLGERSHLLNPTISLETHIKDVLGVFVYEDVVDAVLVSHSYGGMVCSGAMQTIADKVISFVLVDAHLPLEGESLLKLAGSAIEEKVRKLVAEHGEGWFVPTEDSSFWGLTDPHQIAWVNSKITAQPLRTYLDASGPTDRAWTHPGMFIECRPSMHGSAQLERIRARSEKDSRFVYRTLDGGHEPMITNPAALTDLLLEAAMKTHPIRQTRQNP